MYNSLLLDMSTPFFVWNIKPKLFQLLDSLSSKPSLKTFALTPLLLADSVRAIDWFMSLRSLANMKKDHFAIEIARVMYKEERGFESFISYLCIRNYFPDLSLENLIGIASQYGVNYHRSF